MDKRSFLDALTKQDAPVFWRITVIGLGVAAAQAVQELEGLRLHGVEGFAFPSLAEDGFVLTPELKIKIEISDILVIAVGDEDAMSALSILAEMSSELGVTSIGLVSLPGGKQDGSLAELKLRYPGLALLDALIPVWARQPDYLDNAETSAHTSSGSKLQDVLCDLVEILTLRDCLSIDYADIKTLLRYKGNCAYGMGFGQGALAGINALDAALEDMQVQQNSRLECQGVLLYIRSGHDLTMSQFDDIFTRFAKTVDRDIYALSGSSLVKSMQGRVAISILATGMP